MCAYSIPESAAPPALHHDERHSISRELHDNVAQSIAAGLHGLELGEHYSRNGDSQRAGVKRAQAQSLIREALDATKELATVLRAAPGDRLRLVRPTADPPKLPPAELLLIIREALQNAIAHAEAATITIQLSAGHHGVTASVEDDGIGLPTGDAASPLCLGLQSMRERAELLGGSCRIVPGTSAGTRVVVAVPIDGER
jgi:signal transduction histidine kinase